MKLSFLLLKKKRKKEKERKKEKQMKERERKTLWTSRGQKKYMLCNKAEGDVCFNMGTKF